MSQLEGMSNQRIADVLGISLENVKIRLHRARAKLKKALDNGCNFYHNEQAILSLQALANAAHGHLRERPLG